MTEKISRDEYETRKRHDYAGPRSSLLPQTQETWPTSHWVLRSRQNGGTELAPVELDD